MRFTSYKTPVYVEDAINTPEGKPGLSEFERLEKELNAGLGKAEEATNKADTCLLYTSDSGRKIKEEEHLEVGEDEVYIPPDTKAIIFWPVSYTHLDVYKRQI